MYEFWDLGRLGYYRFRLTCLLVVDFWDCRLFVTVRADICRSVVYDYADITLGP